MKSKIPMFTMLLMATTFLVIITTNSMFAWMMMELNMLTFTPLICLQKSATEADLSLKYLIPQSLASSLFMISIIMTTLSPYSNILASASLLMKVGSVPLHAWFPIVMHSINTTAGIILMTWQKIIPLFMLSIPQLSFTPLILFSITASALWGSIAGLNQTNIISMLTFSSIAHLSWLISASLLSIKILFSYLTSYTLTLLPIFLLLNISTVKTHKMIMCSTMEKYQQITMITSLLSLAGLPPLAMFSNKIPIIILMTKTLTVLILMLISAAISLCFYMIVVFTMMLDLPSPSKTSNSTILLKLIYTSSIVFQLCMLPLSFCFIT
uniref:NADH-ubiquinone oxidoreductase chain 2 n=1 Tax=Lamprotula gottschei TaxID=1470580 RepID=A0A1U8V269_9BIVA|nr:NADH dehydrogenase subunit 2 [Lamprotula gottschei]